MADWRILTAAQLAAQLDSLDPSGLCTEQVVERLARHGPNQLPEPSPRRWYHHLARQFSNFIVLLLAAAALVALGLGHLDQAVAIAAALLLNAGIGAWMDARAAFELDQLKALSAPTARLRRGGTVQELGTDQVVPGDWLELEAGDRVAADGLLVEGHLTVDEAPLTGESLGRTKAASASDASDRLVLAGSTVLAGRATALVGATGSATELGHIGRLLAETTPPVPLLDRRLQVLGRYLLVTVSAVAALIFGLGFWQGQPLGPLLETVVVLAIAAIPEGLPTVATLALARGAQRLSRIGLRLRSLSALESLGAVTTLCLDKTGTLTANTMTVRTVVVDRQSIGVSGQGWEPSGELEGSQPGVGLARMLLEVADRASVATLEDHGEGWHVHGDPSDGAIRVAARKAGLSDPPSGLARVRQTPEPGRPWMEVAWGDPEAGETLAKGAPEALLERCEYEVRLAGPQPLDEAGRRYWLEANRQLASQGLRVLGVVQRRDGAWVWWGLVGMLDPPRSGAREAVAQAHRAGVRTVMITGDQAATGLAIAQALDLAAGRPLAVSESEHPSPAITVYARATPQGKHALIEALEEAGEVVAMTGDGVNDAPALRRAAVGLAMGRGTEIARQAAQGVLVRDELEAILAGVAEGRTAFANIQRAVDYLLTCSLCTLLVVLIATAIGAPTPLLPLQILYLNLLTHTLPALGLALEPPTSDALEGPPIAREAALLPRDRLALMLWHALLMATATLALGAWGTAHGGVAHGRSLAFATLATCLLLHTFADRSEKVFGGWRRGGWLWAYLGGDLALQALALGWSALAGILGLVGLDAADGWSVAAASALSAVAVELSKLAVARRPLYSRPG